MAEKESARFFEHGNIEIVDHEYRTREIHIRVTTPCCLFMAATPQLLQYGIISEFMIHHPISVWIPTLTSDRFHPLVIEHVPLAVDKANTSVRLCAEQAIKNFSELLQFMPFPEDLIPTLPLGIYIEFNYRCGVDNLGAILLGLQQTSHHGIAEFRYAMAQVLHCALQDMEKWESGRRLNQGV